MELTIHKIRFSDKQAEYLTALGLKERFGCDFYRTCGFVRSELLELSAAICAPRLLGSQFTFATVEAIRRKICSALDPKGNRK